MLGVIHEIVRASLSVASAMKTTPQRRNGILLADGDIRCR